MLVGYQVERALVQEYPASNHLITASVYSQHVALQHQGCIHGQMVQALLTFPRTMARSMVYNIQNQISMHLMDFCDEPVEGYGIHTVTKDAILRDERLYIQYDFYSTPNILFQPLIGYTRVDNRRLPTPPHVGTLLALQEERRRQNETMHGVVVEDSLF